VVGYEVLLLGRADPTMKHHPFNVFVLTFALRGETVFGW